MRGGMIASVSSACVCGGAVVTGIAVCEELEMHDSGEAREEAEETGDKVEEAQVEGR